MTGIDTTQRQEVFDRARACLRTERRRTIDEQEAFRVFESQVRTLEGQSRGSQADVAEVQLAASGSARGLQAVRDAYEATVMAVPHYEEEYDEPFETHVQTEFGPEIAALLCQGRVLDGQSKGAVLAAAAQAQESRSQLLDALDDEQDSFEDLTAELRSVLEELPEYHEATYADLSFGALDAYRTRLTVLEEKCSAVVDRRQATLVDQRRDLALPIDGPDVPTFVYQTLDVRYPIVATAADALDHVQSLRRDVERALSYSG
jgi:hypothetical protein